MLLEPLMAKTKKDHDTTYESASEFFMVKSSCKKSPNRYWKWKCCIIKCSNCQNMKPVALNCQQSEETVKVSQFERTNTPYKKIDKNGVITEKASKKTDKVEHELTYTQLYEKLSTLKKEYTYYKYQVYNDIYHWFVVLGTTSEIGPIYHMDFSENFLQIHKFKPQSSLFSKAQYSLHCTVKDCSDSDTLTYQSKYVFSLLSSSAKKVSRKGVLYYGVLGHGKGLVDTISAFGVKNPIRRAV